MQPKVKAKKKKKPVGKSPGKQDANDAMNGDESMKEMLLEENGVSDHEGEKEAQEAELADKVSMTGNNQIILVQCFLDCSALRALPSLIILMDLHWCLLTPNGIFWQFSVFLTFPFPKKLLNSVSKQSLVSVYFRINVTECNMWIILCTFLFIAFPLFLIIVSKDTSSSACDYSSFSLPKPSVTQKAAPVKKDPPKEKPS